MEQATRFELVVNQKTAGEIGIRNPARDPAARRPCHRMIGSRRRARRRRDFARPSL
jgi:hypothetical protein